MKAINVTKNNIRSGNLDFRRCTFIVRFEINTGSVGEGVPTSNVQFTGNVAKFVCRRLCKFTVAFLRLCHTDKTAYNSSHPAGHCWDMSERRGEQWRCWAFHKTVIDPNFARIWLCSACRHRLESPMRCPVSMTHTHTHGWMFGADTASLFICPTSHSTSSMQTTRTN